MVYALWSFLNLGLLFFFVCVCFRAARFLRENLGILASIVFVFGLLSFVGNQDTTKAGNNQTKKWTFAAKSSVLPNTIKYNTFDLDKMLTLVIDVGIQYGRDSTSLKLVPIEANSGMTGFVSGYRWEPNLIAVYATSTPQKTQYIVSGLFKMEFVGSNYI